MAAVRRTILLNPGPATTTDSVKQAQVVSDICPREREFGRLMESIAADLTRIAGGSPETHAAVLIGGSGTAAMDACISSVVPPEGRLLVLANGAYGERTAEIADAYRIQTKVLRWDPSVPVDPAVAGRSLSEDAGITTVAMVHHETTSGVLNPIREVGRIARDRGATFLVDAISSFGGIPFSVEDCGVDFLMSTSNKCLQGMAGAAFVVCRKQALKAISPLPRRSYYLSIADLWEHFEGTGQTRFTPPVQTLYALRQALDEFFREGGEGRYARYSESWRTLRAGLQQMGLSILTRPEDESRLLVTVRYPSPSFDFDALHDALYADGYTIYPGKISGIPSFRLSTIGAIDADDIRAFLGALRPALKAAHR